MKEPPSKITLKFCPKCGRDDRNVPFTGKSHFWAGTRCLGKVKTITYELKR